MKKNNLQKSTQQMLDKNRYEQECMENKKRKETGNFGSKRKKIGADRGRTGDLMNAIHALYQLSYSPFISICF